MSEEHKSKISASSPHQPPSAEHVRAIKEANSKEFTLVSPGGEVVQGKNITEFARQHGLTHQAVYAVLLGKRNSHKGWTKYNG